ncbi:hypothetical protein BCR44DRAFT_56372 [Catenaria anguillulae PL171]|uniref:PHD-type domain-containing protein n=1 Tax=Catenaria anguillulae PL171 TaxID=765915 RepID=A0A1Y2I403_9FUNG|nr:hypothetical protein BCR44DRAFT_56372 [Catenaria anguillulae PL171]
MNANHSGAASAPASASAACSGRHPFPPARLQPALAHTLSQAGFTHFSQHTLDVLCDLFERYLIHLASRAALHAHVANRASAHANLIDVQAALADLNIDLESLREFVDAGWTKKLNHLDFDLALESVPAIPVPSKHQLTFYKEAALKDDRWVLPPNFAWPLVVPCDMLLDHVEFDPLDPLFVSAPSASLTTDPAQDKDDDEHEEVSHRPEGVEEGKLYPNRPPSAIDAVPIYDHSGNVFPMHIPTHMPPFPGSIPSASSTSVSGPARGFQHHLAASPTSITQHPWSATAAPTSPTRDTTKKKSTITVSGNAKALASIAAKSSAASTATAATDTNDNNTGESKVELDMDLVRTSLGGKQWRLPAPGGDPMSPTSASSSASSPSVQPPPLRANPNTSRHLRRRTTSPPPPTAAAITKRPQRPKTEALLGRALQAATSLSRASSTPSAPSPGAAAAADSTAPPNPTTYTPSLLPILHAPHPAAHLLATAYHADSLFTPSAATAAPHNDLDPVFPRIDLVPIHSLGPRAKPIMDDILCAGCPLGDARKTMDDGQLLVQCDKCKKWSHGKCVGVTKEAISAGTISEFWCSDCRRRASGVGLGAGGAGGGGGGREVKREGAPAETVSAEFAPVPKRFPPTLGDNEPESGGSITRPSPLPTARANTAPKSAALSLGAA